MNKWHCWCSGCPVPDMKGSLCLVPPGFLKRVLLEHDFDTERMFRDRGERKNILFISCEGLVKNESLMNSMREMLSLIQEAYDYPVDVEYTINEFDVICEVAERRAGYMPELSYGSHIFQDLVEAGILYGAVFDNERQWHSNRNCSRIWEIS